MSGHGEQPDDFAKTVTEIKTAEEDYDKIIVQAKEKAAAIASKNSEQIADGKKKSSEEMVLLKNSRLSAGMKEIEKSVQKTIQKAKEDGEKVSKKELSSDEIAKIAKEFLSSL
ncbi:hypothetical protein HY988_05975 [Candidatus Micrarchaeota archaeon]|nr:hypothetical protein [Candidatus Micrarchaeota archaeon]